MLLRICHYASLTPAHLGWRLSDTTGFRVCSTIARAWRPRFTSASAFGPLAASRLHRRRGSCQAVDRRTSARPRERSSQVRTRFDVRTRLPAKRAGAPPMRGTRAQWMARLPPDRGRIRRPGRASVSQDRPRLLAPERPRQTDDGAAVSDWKESRSRRPEHGQRLPLSDKCSHADAVTETPTPPGRQVSSPPQASRC
jgi:hypothetical protein